ncbi:MAG: hypothetical protein M3506_00640 [Chloroflexota bacterium]|nr:hypothetical protein [Chloroflexota bacterium]
MTQQLEPQSPAGICFSETMAGGFTLGTDDVAEGDRQGKAAGNILAIHCDIAVQNLDRFVADRDEPGTLSGTVDYPPLGTGLSAERGVFNLFSPADDPKTRLMVYELGFQHNEEDYYLAGKKEVRDDFGVDLWTDTTTLYTRLHRGTDARGPVTGAGILRLGPAELMRLLSTLRVTHAATKGDEARAIATFGRFFMGQLWASYARMVAR